MCNLNSGNRLIDPKSVSQHIKLILKVFEINKIWVKPFFFRPPSSSQPKNSFLARTVSFVGGFFKERYQIAQEDLLLQTRHVPNVSETSPLYSPPLLLVIFLTSTPNVCYVIILYFHLSDDIDTAKDLHWNRVV